MSQKIDELHWEVWDVLYPNVNRGKNPKTLPY